MRNQRSKSTPRITDASEDSRVRVVIRIRPLNENEQQRKYKCVLDSDGDQRLTVWDPACFEIAKRQDLQALDPECWSRDFNFDRCLWSLHPQQENYASQDTVFEVIGQPVLDWIFDGFNSCIFAFGQTGAGKSHTMMGNVRGNARQYGLIPRICFGLFDRLENAPSTDGSETVTFSHMEIYNENVRDLLGSAPPNVYLKVREHPRTGIFVEHLTCITVKSFEEVMSLISKGEKNRTVAATNSNTHSSRSHAIVTLTVRLRVIHAPKNGLPTSALHNKIGRVHLVDLAGSERVTLSGAKDTRLREANHINKSLSVLGDVIKALGDMKNSSSVNTSNSSFSSNGSVGKKANAGIHIPYRNSALTMILKDSLGGNSHAVMVAAVSPSSADYEETVSTLKYADRAKRVRMKVQANVSSGLLATDSSAAYLVPLLQAEVRRLKEMLKLQQDQQQTEILHQLHKKGTNSVFSFSNNALKGNGPPSSLNTDRSSLVSPTGETSPNIIVEEMKSRVIELETQLEEREKLIESLEILRSEDSFTNQDQSRIEEEESMMSQSQLPPRTLVGQRSLSAPRPSDQGKPPRSSRNGRYDNDDFEQLAAPPPPPQQAYPQSMPPPAQAPKNNSDYGVNPSDYAKGKSPSGGPSRLQQPVVVLSDNKEPSGGVPEDAIDTRLPRLINLNQDPLFSECLVYYIAEGRTTVGKSEEDADILITGPDIKTVQCILYNKKETVWVEPLEDALLFTNGEVLCSSMKEDITVASSITAMPKKKVVGRFLYHGDRIAFGRFHLFRYEAAGQPPISSKGESTGWELAHEELSVKNEAIMRLRSSLALDGQTLQQHLGMGLSGSEEGPITFFSGPSPLKKQLHPRVSFSDTDYYDDDPKTEMVTTHSGNDFVVAIDVDKSKSSFQSDEENRELPIYGVIPSYSAPVLTHSLSADDDDHPLTMDKTIKVEPSFGSQSYEKPRRVEWDGVVSETSSQRSGQLSSQPFGLSRQEEPNLTTSSSAVPAPYLVPAPASPSPNRYEALSARSPSSTEGWWDHLNRVAEGTTNANPDELRDMLKSLLVKAEVNVSRRGANRGNVSPQNIHKSSSASPVQSTTPASPVGSHKNSAKKPMSTTGISSTFPPAGNYNRHQSIAVDSSLRNNGIVPNPAGPLNDDPHPSRQDGKERTLNTFQSQNPSLSDTSRVLNYTTPESTVSKGPVQYGMRNSVASSSPAADVVKRSPHSSAGKVYPAVANPPATPVPASAGADASAESSLSPEAFEKEAMALHLELATMQQALQDRMKRYSALSSYAP